MSLQIFCKICEEEYSEDTVERIPRSLSECGHTICQICACRIINNENIECPFDKIMTKVPQNDVKSLKKNFAILELIDEKKRDRWREKAYENAKLLKDGLEEDEDSEYAEEKRLNINCDENIKHTAVLYCLKCETHLCKNCWQLTHSSNSLSKHRRVKISEKPKPLIYCKSHPHNVAEIICKEENCKVGHRVMCHTCHLYGQHKGHKHELFEIEYEVMRSNIEETIGKLDEMKTMVENYIDDVESHSERYFCKLDTEVENKEKEMRRFFNRLREDVNEAEDEALRAIRTGYSVRKTFWKQKEMPLESAAENIDNHLAHLKQNLSLGEVDIVETNEETQKMIESAQKMAVPAPVMLNVYHPILYSFEEKFAERETNSRLLFAFGFHEEGYQSIIAAIRNKCIRGTNQDLETECVTMWIDSYLKLRNFKLKSDNTIILIAIDNYDEKTHTVGIDILRKVLNEAGGNSIIVAIHKYMKHKVNRNLENELLELGKDSSKFMVRYYDFMIPDSIVSMITHALQE